MLEHILQNNDHILDIDLVVTVNIAVSGVLPVAVAGLRLIPALAGGNIELVDLAVVVHVAGCALAPEAQITREQMASMMMRYAQFNQYNTSKSADLSAFNDAGPISSWALESMKWANAAGLINGRTASTIAPQGTATRAEAATILMRFCEMSK